MVKSTRATFGEVKKKGASSEPSTAPLANAFAWLSNSRSIGLPARKSSGFMLQYPVRERTMVPPRSNLDGVATPVAGVRRRIANDVILVLLFGNAFHAREQVISVVNEKTSGAISKLIKNLLVHRGILRKRRNQLARLKVRVVQICV